MDGRLVVNPGSVGLPAYDDVSPFPLKIEAAHADASYALISGGPGAWHVEFRRIPYDVAAAAATARSFGWDHWAYNLETGRVR